jgi:diaminohydroxyphosphoribosylaminopyrimidine deaminase / 5-amino-6-(5-phosphoribosylamino)uracil reductase
MVTQEKLSLAMYRACTEARLWLGATSPNPPVGAVALDASDDILAVAAHEKAGRSHAESKLIDQCRIQGILGRVHTLVVTLSPCNHQGRTPSCCDAIIGSGIRHIVVGTIDPNPAVSGDSLEKLRQSGIDVTLGVEKEMCRQLIYAFAYSVTTGHPWITIKRAFDEHGSMIPPVGQKTFTSDTSLKLAHQLRKRADAILTGSGTIVADDSSFTVRHVPDYDGKTRILAILDRRKRVPSLWLKEAAKRRLVPIVYDNLEVALQDLAGREVREVLVEAGPLLSQAMIKDGFWTMDVKIHKGNPDDVRVAFNPKATLPFDPAKWRWENVLPGLSATV